MPAGLCRLVGLKSDSRCQPDRVFINFQTRNMKTILKLTGLIILVQFGACKDDNEINPQHKSVEILTATSWGNGTVTHAIDGDLSDQYENFAIVFTKKPSADFEGTFVVASGGYAFSENTGKWKFSEDLKQIIFDSGREFDFQLDENHLRLDFSVSLAGGRGNGLSGHFVFDLKPL